jgi:protoheme ferro-lyase
MLLSFLIVLLLSFLLGVCIVRYLTVHPLQMNWYLLLVCLFSFGLVLLLIMRFEHWDRLIALGVSLISVLAGYAYMTRVLHNVEGSRYIPEITRAQHDPGTGHCAVIYFAHGEPETYNPIGWIHTFNEFDESGVRFMPFLVRPYFLHLLRKKYLTVGKSDHHKMHVKMMHRLEEAFRAEGDITTKFYLSFVDDAPHPDEAAIQALNEGASHLIVAEVFVTNSNHTSEGKELIETLDLENYHVSLEYTGPMWDSKTLHRMFPQKVNAHLGSHENRKVGVLLVGHGQPQEWDQTWPTETEQENRFRQSVLSLFEAEGFNSENLGLAWMEFREPEPARVINQFVLNGVAKIFYFSAAISADAIHSQYDVPALVNAANVPEMVELVNLGAWNDHPMVIQAIREKILEKMVK